jgi:hypothetical protein
MLIIFEGKKVFCLFSSTELKILVQENFFGFVSKAKLIITVFVRAFG